MKPNSIKYEFLPLGTVLYAVCLCIRHDVYAVGEKMLSFQFVLRCKCMQSLINSIQNVDLLLLECEMPYCTVLWEKKEVSSKTNHCFGIRMKRQNVGSTVREIIRRIMLIEVCLHWKHVKSKVGLPEMLHSLCMSDT